MPPTPNAESYDPRDLKHKFGTTRLAFTILLSDTIHFLSSLYARTGVTSPLDLVHLSGGLVAAHEVEVAPGGDQVQSAPVQTAQLGHQLLCETPAGATVSTGPERASLERVVGFMSFTCGNGGR